MIAIVDYGMGNVRSVFNALSYIGEDALITADESKIRDASHIILPGVGAFGKAIRNLKEKGLIDALNHEVIIRRKPFLGICLGMELLAKCSYEHGFNSGFGWIDSEVKMFNFSNNGLKLPHVGWNDITVQIKHPIFAKLKCGQFTFYFVHSYHMVCADSQDMVATCDYGYSFAAVVARENIIGTQFHPEKSQDNGLQILENFVHWNP